ncbi:EAL domain-containing protein [Pseudoxanthomonas sp. LjRoot143]|uniref:putative bifunctional diguanylate cyclase/phosphodiesterase n=1 Tax=Pseudoxanthomonas sp. LjRoot143 TaxID=3342266 RepID=UPI003ED000D3
MDPGTPPSPGDPAFLSDDDIRLRLDFLDLGSADRDRLLQLWDVVQASESANIDRFYAQVGAFAETGAYIRDWQQLQRLHHAQKRYSRDLFTAHVDRQYVENRWRIGAVHHRIGLEPHWYLAGCSTLLTAIMDSLKPLLREDPEFHAQALKSTIKRLFFDIGVVMDAYVSADRKALSDSTASLRESESLLSEAHDLAQLARWELLLPEGRLHCCARAREMLRTEELLECGGYEHLRRWVHPLDRPALDAAFATAVASGIAYDVRYRVEGDGHPPRMLRERGRALADVHGHGKRVVGTIQDISHQVSQLSRIEQLALYDDLTELPNRAHFYAELERLITDAAASGRVFSVLFIDLDEFKDINDTKGHTTGDAVLVEIGRRLRDELDTGQHVARLGGDEFVVLAPGTRTKTAQAIARRLNDAITQPMTIGGTVFGLKASIGISVYPQDGASSELLLRNADTAMYEAKRSRLTVGTYHPDMSARLERRVQLADRLERALRDGSLELHYQPQVAIADGRLVGAEALLRWRDAVLGQVSPDEFVPLAEHRGLIQPLGRWVIATACAQLRAWDAAGLSLPGRLAINLSPRQFDEPEMAGLLIEQIAAAGLQPQRFDLELTESGLMADPDASLATLSELKSAGFSLSLDDFGMGYSSLAHLKGFPLNRLKLDRTFVRGMLEHRHDYAIVVATIAMARSLDLQLTAEGVESAAQADVLLSLGCGQAQGFLFDAALSPADFAARWLMPARAQDGQPSSVNA